MSSKTNTFTLSLGPKHNYDNHPMASLHHEKDYYREILVDLDDGREFSLGLLVAGHDVLSGKLRGVHLYDEDCNNLPGESPHSHRSAKAAMVRAEKWLTNFLAGGAA